MAIQLSAENRTLIDDARVSYLAYNYSSGISSFIVVNSSGFAANDYLLLGSFGGEQNEIVQVLSVNSSTHTITLVAATVFSHPESTKVTIIKYNQVQFYHTATATFATTDLLATVDVQADDLFTKTYDSTNSTGFGWFRFYNETSSLFTTNSNAIPYAGFTEGSVKEIMDSFFSTLNNKEMKLVSVDDFFRWLNEAYSIAINELNLTNSAVNVGSPITVSVVSGTAEYDLSDNNLGNILRVADEDGNNIDHIDIKDIAHWEENGTVMRYYLKGIEPVIGFSPEPSEDENVSVYFEAKSTILNSYYDNIKLPNNSYYFLLDFILFRASEKLPRISGEAHYAKFKEDLNRLKLTSFKQQNSVDSWGIDGDSIV